MVEYIEKGALMSLIESEAHRWGDDYDWWQCLADIEDFKPADVRPVARSHWKKNDNGTYSCERCHSWIPEEQWHYANWCLYCGADMRGGDANGDTKD